MEKIAKSVYIFKALGDETRIKIIEVIYREERNVSEIAKKLNMNQSAISHQLKILKNSSIVKNRRQGKEIYYYLSDEHIRTLIDTVFTHADDCEGIS